MKLNRFLKRFTVTGFLTFGLLATCSLSAKDSGRYTIIEAGERAFLLDTETGANWRYFFNNIGEQGWSGTEFMILGEKENSYSFEPYGKLYKSPKESSK